jgi:hypothetical protein
MMRIMVLQLLAWQYVAASLQLMAPVLGLGQVGVGIGNPGETVQNLDILIADEKLLGLR